MASDDLRARIAEIRTGMTETYLTPPSDVRWLLNTVEQLTAEAERAQRLNDAAWGSVWLHGKWSWLTKNMTTPEREHAADCVARWCALVDAEDGEPGRGEPEGLRWWRESFSPPAGAAVCERCQTWEMEPIKHTRCPSCGQPWNNQPTTKE